MDLIFMVFFIIISAVYILMSIQKKSKSGLILGSVCFVIFSIMSVLVYLAQNNSF